MSHVATVREIYESFGRDDIAAILDRLEDDVDWEHDSVDHGIPWLKPRRGRDEVAGFFAGLSALEIRSFEPFALLEGEDRVAALIRIEAVVRSTGRSYKDYEVHVWTFGDSGRVKAFRHVVDTHQHLMALRG